jgi:hypothetical protein
VIWLILFQRLHPKGTLAVAVREMLTGGVRAHLRWPKRKKTRRLSANTSALSQARSKLPLEVVEQVSDQIFESLNQQPKSLPDLSQPMFLLDPRGSPKTGQSGSPENRPVVDHHPGH